MNYIIAVFFTLIGIFNSVYSQTKNKIPNGNYILINGILEDAEWDDAKIIRVDSTTILLIKQDDKNLFLGVKFIKEKHTGIDLYLSCENGSRYMFHISSTLGERKYMNNEWTEIKWVLTKYWSGNTIGIYINDHNERQIIKPEGFEFQINKKIIESSVFRIRLHLKRPEKVFPLNSSEKDVNEWYKLEL